MPAFIEDRNTCESENEKSYDANTADDAVSVGEQEDIQVSEVCREADGKITDNVKKTRRLF